MKTCAEFKLYANEISEDPNADIRVRVDERLTSTWPITVTFYAECIDLGDLYLSVEYATLLRDKLSDALATAEARRKVEEEVARIRAKQESAVPTVGRRTTEVAVGDVLRADDEATS